MVTKVKNIRQATEFASNFEWDVDGSTGLVFRTFPGSAIQADGTVKEFLGQGIVLPANQQVTVYVDLGADPIVVTAEATVTSGNYVPLYLVNTSGSAITNVQDLRSWTSAAIGTDLGQGGGGALPFTSFDTLIQSYSPTIWYRFNEAGLQDDLVNHGSAGTSWNLPWFNLTNDSYNNVFPRRDGGDIEGSHGMGMALWNPNGGDSQKAFYKDIGAQALTPFTSSSTGTWIVNVALAETTQSNNDAIFCLGIGATSNQSRLQFSMTNDDMRVAYYTQGASTVGDHQVTTPSNRPVNDTSPPTGGKPFPQWQQFVIVQRGDGRGIRLYRNGQDESTYSGTLTAGEEDYWMDNWTLEDTDRLLIAATTSGASNVASVLAGTLSCIAYTETALTDAQVKTLYQTWSGNDPNSTTAAYIETLNPLHWWKSDLADDTWPDSGSDGTWDLGLISTAPTYFLDGPQTNDFANDWNTTTVNYADVDSATFGDTGDDGAIVVYYYLPSGRSWTVNEFLVLGTSTTWASHLSVGFGGFRGFGVSGRISFSQGTDSSNYRIQHGPVSAGTSLDTWHCLVINKATGSNPTMYIDGSSQTLSQFTGGTPPAQDTWWDDYTLTDAAMATGGINDLNSNYHGYLSHVFIMPRDLTTGEITQLASYL